MGFRGNFLAKVTWISPFLLLFFSPEMVETQIPGCSFQGLLGLEQCLNQGKNSISNDQSCCIVLNQVVQAGFHCLCLLLASFNPQLSTPLVLPLSNCFISVPPLTQCQALVPAQQPPVTPVLQPPVPPAQPVLLPPDIPQEQPGTPALQVLLPPDIPQEPPQPSAPNDFLLHPTPPPQELPLKSTEGKNSTSPAMQPSLNNNCAPDLNTYNNGYLWISKGRKKTIPFQSRLSLAATLCACII